MSSAPFLAMLLAGLAGGFGHCIGMCGPVVATLTFGETRQGLLHHLLYNLGRVTTYSILGAIVGISGSFLVLTTASIVQLQRVIMVIAGLSIILMGLSTAEWLPLPQKKSCNPGNSLIQKIFVFFKAPRSIGSYYPMGIVLGFLPCGLTYTALLTAARSGMEAKYPFAGMMQGALMMMLFGIGTVPAMLLVGKVVNTISNSMRKRFYRVASIIMIVMGMWFVARGW